MKTLLSYFVNEQNINEAEFTKDGYIASSLGFKRSRMPQLPKDKLDTFLIHLADKYGAKRIEINPKRLKPIQGELDMDKVHSISKDSSFEIPAFITSTDLRIADGHHSHAALMLNGNTNNVVVYRTNLSAPKLIEVLNKMKHSFTEK